MSRFFFFQAEDGIRDLVRSRGLGDVYKRQDFLFESLDILLNGGGEVANLASVVWINIIVCLAFCLLYTSDAADERSSVDLGGRRIIKKKNRGQVCEGSRRIQKNKQAEHSIKNQVIEG